jgi:hypothetical protein
MALISILKFDYENIAKKLISDLKNIFDKK